MKQHKLIILFLAAIAGQSFGQSADKDTTNTHGERVDTAIERQAWREALELWTDDSPTFTGGTYTGDLFIGGKLNVGSGAADDGHIVNFVSEEDVATEVMLHLEWNSPTPLAGDSNALLFTMYDSALNETEYSRFRSVIEDPTDGSEDGAMTVDVLNNGVLEQAVLFSHDEIIMNDNGGDRNFIVKDNTTAEVFRITGGTGSIAMDTDTLFVDSANNRVGVGDSTPSEALEVANGNVLISQADAQLKFAPRSAQNITQYIDTDVSDLLYIGDTSAGKSILFGGGYAGGMRVDAGGLIIGTGNNIEFDSNSGTWNGATIAGAQTFSNDATISSKLILDTNGGSGTEGIIAIDDGYGAPTLIQQTGGDIITFTDSNDNGSHDAYETIYLNYSLGGGGLGLGGTDAYNAAVFVGTNYMYMGSGLQIYGAFEVSDQVELTYQSVNSDDSAMNYELTKSHIDWWSDMYFNVNGETDTNNKFSINKSGDRFFHMFAYTGSAAGDGQWVDFQSPSYGIPYGSGAKGHLRDKWSFKFKFDSNATTNTDTHLWFVRGKAANATLPTASDVCFALKFEGEEDLMIAVYDGVTAHTTTIDLSTINTYFTNLSTQQEYMWTWSGTQAKVYGRYRLPAGTGNNDWSAWFTIGTLTPSGMAASTTNLTTGNAYFLQHTPVTSTGYTKSFFIWDVAHSSTALIPN